MAVSKIVRNLSVVYDSEVLYFGHVSRTRMFAPHLFTCNLPLSVPLLPSATVSLQDAVFTDAKITEANKVAVQTLVSISDSYPQVRGQEMHRCDTIETLETD